MNNISLIIFMTTIPIILILVFIYGNDKKKEPFFLLMELFILGMLSCGLVILTSKFLGIFLPFITKKLPEMNFIETILYAFIGVALIEELCKWFFVYTKGYHNKEFDELYDIIVYAVFVSLGFAFIENILYVQSSGKLLIAVLRALSAVPGHACDAIFMGYYLSMAKVYKHKKEKNKEKKYILLSILIPTILHGIYDFCLMSKMKILLVLFVVFVIFLYIISILKLKEIIKENKKVKVDKDFCPKCGSKMEGHICSKCRQEED